MDGNDVFGECEILEDMPCGKMFNKTSIHLLLLFLNTRCSLPRPTPPIVLFSIKEITE
jgi:hypothetical protein